jgi:hypothetical protein
MLKYGLRPRIPHHFVDAIYTEWIYMWQNHYRNYQFRTRPHKQHWQVLYEVDMNQAKRTKKDFQYVEFTLKNIEEKKI